MEQSTTSVKLENVCQHGFWTGQGAAPCPFCHPECYANGTQGTIAPLITVNLNTLLDSAKDARISQLEAQCERLREKAEWADVWESEKTLLQSALAAAREENEHWIEVGREIEKCDPMYSDDRMVLWSSSMAALRGIIEANRTMRSELSALRSRADDTGPIPLAIYTTDDGRITSVVERDEDGDPCDREIDATAVIEHVNALVDRLDKVANVLVENNIKAAGNSIELAALKSRSEWTSTPPTEPGSVALGIAKAIDALSDTLYRCSGDTLRQARLQRQQLVDALCALAAVPIEPPRREP